VEAWPSSWCRQLWQHTAAQMNHSSRYAALYGSGCFGVSVFWQQETKRVT
jgi:hypothetical protein